MSRIGKLPIEIVSGVTVTVNGQDITVKGAKAQSSFTVPSEIIIKQEAGQILLKPANDSQKARAMWGLSRTMVHNMVKGVTTGYSVTLEITGVGYKAAVQGKVLKLNLGFSHDVNYDIPEGIEIKAEKPTTLVISGFDKQRVGQVAAEIRRMKKPEPYKGKGIRYSDEKVRRKEGKKK